MGANRSEDTVLVCKACVVRAGLTPSDLHPMSKAGLVPDDLDRMTRAGWKCGNCDKSMQSGEGHPWLVKDLPIVSSS